MIALEATWEIEQLTETIRELCDSLLPLNEKGSPLRLRLRGLTARINDLVGVAMSILDEDDETGSLHRRVHGDWPARREAASNAVDPRGAAAASSTEGTRHAH